MAINTYLSTIKSQKTNQENRDKIMGMEISWRLISWKGMWGNGRRGEGNKKYKFPVIKTAAGM